VAEGDTILRLARRIEASLVGSELSARTPGARRPEGLPISEIDGRELLTAEARGKHLLLRFADGLVVHSHLGMKGAWHLYRPGERWRKPARAAWLALAAPSGAEAVNFNGTSMRIARTAELARDRRLSQLGPDVLGEEFSPKAGAASLRRAGATAELGEVLLDQRLLAGVGNIFKSEGCWEARLSPWRRLGDLSDEELVSAVAAARELMLTAVESGRQPKRVYNRSRMPCPRCGARIASRGQGDSARISYWCPGCQN
jgi:endonuclease-8